MRKTRLLYLSFFVVVLIASVSCKPKRSGSPEAREPGVEPAQQPCVSARDPFKPIVPVSGSAVAEQAGIKDIQAALKNAGFYEGALDGLMGKKTLQAIKAFQQAHGLAPDGKVGKKTWQALSHYSLQ